MKIKKKEILRNKEQSTVQSAEQPSVQSPVQSTEQPPVESTVQSSDTYFYGVGILAVLAIGVCVFFAFNTFPKNKKPVNEKQDQPPKRCPML